MMHFLLFENVHTLEDANEVVDATLNGRITGPDSNKWFQETLSYYTDYCIQHKTHKFVSYTYVIIHNEW